MEALVGLMVLVSALAMLAGPVLAILALVRVRGLRRSAQQVERLQFEVDLLRSAVETLQGSPEPSEQAPPPTVPRPPVREVPKTVTPPRPAAPAAPAVPQPPAAKPAARPAPPPIAPPSEPGTTEPRDVPPTPPAASGNDWERWVGIRGAAVLGAVALGLAGLLFFKYSIERGLITPTMRVVLGTVVGLGCLGGSRWLRPRGYAYPSAALAGAGIVVLYGAFWAAHVLYGLIGVTPALVLMVLVTAAACVLAVADASLIIAVLGLVGGFATPLLLSSGSDRPIGLFGYVLLLDVALLTVGYKRNWPSLGLLSLAGTVLLEALWIGTRMGPDRLLLGLIILGVFALLFVAAGRFAPETLARGRWVWSQAAAVLFPFAFAVYFAGRVDLAPRLYPIAILLALLSVAAGWLARERGQPSLAVGAAAASTAVVAVWLFQHPIDNVIETAAAWELVAVSLGLSLVFHAFVELDRETTGVDGPAPAAQVATGGFFVLLWLAAGMATGIAPWPWIVGWSVLTVVLYRHGSFPARAHLPWVAAVGLGVGLSLVHLVHHQEASYPGGVAYFALLVLAAVVVQSVGFFRQDEGQRIAADRAAAALPMVLLLLLGISPMLHDLGAWAAMGGSLLLGVLVLLAATRLGHGGFYVGAVFATAFVHWAWTGGQDPRSAATALFLQFAAVLVFTGWVFVGRGSFAANPAARYAAALAAPIWFLPMRGLYENAFGGGTIGLLPVVLGAVSLAAVARARTFWSDEAPARLSGLVWFSAVALGFLSVAIPLQLDKEWITIGWALEGVAVIVLWKRLDHPGL